MKLYAADVGIRNHVTGYRDKDKDAIFENLVFLKVKEKNPYYIYQNGIELDFHMNNTLVEVEFERELEGKQKILFDEFQANKKILFKNLDDYLGLQEIL